MSRNVAVCLLLLTCCHHLIYVHTSHILLLVFLQVATLSSANMCECFGRADIEIEELPPRYYGGPPIKRISLVRDIDRDHEDAYQRNYSRPRSSTASMRQIEYRPARYSRQKDDEEKDTKSQYKSPPKIDYPNSSRFVPLPPVLREDRIEEIHEPKKSILRSGKKKYNSQPSMVLYSPKRGRRERRYYYEDEESDGDSWVGRPAMTELTEASGDSWAMRPVKKYADTKWKGRSRSRGRGRGRYD